MGRLLSLLCYDFSVKGSIRCVVDLLKWISFTLHSPLPFNLRPSKLPPSLGGSQSTKAIYKVSSFAKTGSLSAATNVTPQDFLECERMRNTRVEWAVPTYTRARKLLAWSRDHGVFKLLQIDKSIRVLFIIIKMWLTLSARWTTFCLLAWSTLAYFLNRLEDPFQRWLTRVERTLPPVKSTHPTSFKVFLRSLQRRYTRRWWMRWRRRLEQRIRIRFSVV